MSRASRRRAAEAAAQAANQARERREEEDRQRYDEERRKADEERKARQTYAPWGDNQIYGLNKDLSDSAKSEYNAPGNRENPSVQVDSLDFRLDALKRAASREADVRYAKDMISPATEYQEKMQGIASNASDRQIRTQNEADLKRDEVSAGVRRYEADQSLAGTRETAGASRYSADRGLDIAKYQSDSDERQIGLTGQERRKELEQGTKETLALRRDARGAIATSGKRFYG